MTHLLPPNLLALFTPRPALRYVEPSDCPQELRRTAKITGVAEYMNAMQEGTGEHAYTESPLERKDRIKDEAREKRHKQLTEGVAQYKPKEDANAGGYDPFKTLFVYRLSYRATVNDLEKAFGQYGRVARVKIPIGLGKDDKKAKHKGRPRGYAFVVFDHESDMREAYRRSQGLTINGRAVAVDVERSHTVQNWKPRRLGGGVGPGRVSGLPKMSDRFARAPSGPGRGGFGGFRGGRGDFRGGRGGFRGGRGDFRGGPPSGPRGGDFDRRGANYEPVQPRGSYRERGGERGGYEDRPRYDDRRRDGPRFDDRRRDERPRW